MIIGNEAVTNFNRKSRKYYIPVAVVITHLLAVLTEQRSGLADD